MMHFVIGLSPVLDILGGFGVGKLFSYLEYFFFFFFFAVQISHLLTR